MTHGTGDRDGRHWADRARRWLGRSKAAPARIDRLHAESEEFRHRLDEVAGALERLEGLVADLRTGLDGLASVREADETRGVLDRLDATVREEASLTRVAVSDQLRDETVERLVAEHGHDAPLSPGLSVITITWNHAGFLEESISSSLASLDTLPDDLAGEVLVLDDRSTDETPTVLDALSRSDSRLRVIRSPVGLALSRARNVLLHTCRTSHAFVLDADNVAFPEGVEALYDIARTWNSTFTYGTVVKARPDGSEYLAASHEPPTAALRVGNYIDSMAVVDVGALRRLGGYTLDPLLHRYDDYELVSRLGRLGELLAFVPTAVGRYRILDTSHIQTVTDSRTALGRLERSYRSDGGVDPKDMAVLAAHPATGPIWATPAAVALRPTLADALGSAVPTPPTLNGPRVLVVSSGGFRNVGDDAMARGVFRRLRAVAPDVRIDLVTDGDALLEDSGQLAEGVLWVGTLPEVVAGLDSGPAGQRLLDPADYALVVCSGGGYVNPVFGDHARRRAALVTTADVAGVPVVFTGQGIGPLEIHDGSTGSGGGIDEGVVRCLVERSTSFGLREPLSAEVLADLGLDAPPVEVVGDDAIGFPPATDTEADAALQHAGVDPGAPVVAVHLRQAGYVGVSDASADQFATVADAVASGRQATVLGIALCDTPPVSETVRLVQLGHGAAPRLAPWRILECHEDPALLAAALRRADAALVHSYHAAVFALEHRTPVLLFVASDYYRHKAEGLRRLAGLPAEFVVDVGSGAEHPMPGVDEIEERLAAVSEVIEARSIVLDAGRVDDFFEHAVGAVLRDASGSHVGES